MKDLDVCSVEAIAAVIENRYGYLESGYYREMVKFWERSGVTIPTVLRDLLQSGIRQDVARMTLLHINGTADLERVLLRLASPVEYAGDPVSHGDIFDMINQILWAEGLKIELDGPYPYITDSRAVEHENIHSANAGEAYQSLTAEVRNIDNKIFIVHGRDIGAKEIVAGFLERIKLEPVVLQDMPSQGSTVIEKFEHYASKVGFAVVLFTPDDVGSLSNDTSNTQPRARQNVVFELGYFIGNLGRNRVCVLTKGNIEILSDYSGVLSIPMDDVGGWTINLVRELRSAGYNVDANNAL